MNLKIRRNSYLRHAIGNFFFCCFCQLFVMSSVNFDVCLIAFVMHFLNGVSFSKFVLIRGYCTPLNLYGFPNATTLLSRSFEFRKIQENLIAKRDHETSANCSETLTTCPGDLNLLVYD